MDGDNENVSAKPIVVSTSFKDTKGKSHITIEEFLNFLKTAYQVRTVPLLIEIFTLCFKTVYLHYIFTFVMFSLS